MQNFGAWKNEGIATKGRWVRQKCYLEEFYNEKKYFGLINRKYKINLLKNKIKRIKLKPFKEIKITCAGMPKSCYSQVEWDKFKVGMSVGGKLTFKHVKGGVKLVETDFTIKDIKLSNNIAKFDKK